MIKLALPAAVAVIALGAPAVSHAQMAPPMQPVQPNGVVTNANATITGQPQPGPYDVDQGGVYQAPLAQPMAPYAPRLGPVFYTQPVTPRTTWIPAHYDWDPSTSNYVYTEGQFVEAPRENAQWLPGHWIQTPTSWIWIDGTWN
jgi:hypothetical protein